MKNLATALASIMASVAKAMGSFTWRWCQKTGTWIQERVVQPAMDYTADAASGALAAVTGFVPDVVKSTFKLPGQLIRSAAAVAEGGGRLAGASLKAVAAVPGAVVSGIAGGAGAMPPPPPAPESTKADRLIQNAAEALEQRRMVNVGLRRADQMMMRRSDIVGEAIHQFASAAPEQRAMMDLSGIPDALQAWLLTASPEQLARLAAAGPVKCGMLATGQRTGIVGFDMPTVRPEPVEAPLDQPTLGMTVGAFFDTDGALAARIAAAKGLREGWHPAH